MTLRRKRRIVTWLVPIILFAISLLILESFPSLGTSLIPYSSLIPSSLLAVIAERVLNRLLGEDSKTAGIAQAREKQRLEDDREWRQAYQEHSVLIGESIRSGWKDGVGVLTTWSFERGIFRVSPPLEPDIDYYEQAKSHLELGYSDVWASFVGMRSKSVEICEAGQHRVDSFSKIVRENLAPAFPSELLSGEGLVTPALEKCCYIRIVFDTIFFQAHLKMVGRPYGSFNIGNLTVDIKDGNGQVTRKTVSQLSFSGQPLGHGSFVDMQQLQNIVEELLGNASIQTYVKEYNQLNDQQKDCTMRIDRQVRKIQTRVQARDPLKGSCDLCPKKISTE